MRKIYSLRLADYVSFVHPAKKMAVAFIATVLFLGANTIFAQPSSANYAFSSSSSGSLVDMSSGTTQAVAASTDGGLSSVTSLSFPFVFMGKVYTHFVASSDGAIKLGEASMNTTGIGLTNDLTPSTIYPVIAPFWDDLATNSTGKVHFRVDGVAPNRTLVVEWLNMEIRYASSTADGTYQAILHEGTGVIDFIYGTMNIGAAQTTAITASIGFSNGNTANTFASVTALSPVTVSTTVDENSLVNSSTAGPIVGLNSAADGSRVVYTWTPTTTALAPTNLTFPLIGMSYAKLNWNDNATNESSYAIFSSTDGVTYSYLTTLPANSTSYTITGLTPSTPYYYQVFAVAEGTLSSALSGNVTTTGAASPLAGTYTINNLVATGGTNFNSFFDAITVLNGEGISSAVTFNVSAGQLFLEDAPAITATGTSTNTITFQRSGAGANPVLKPTGTSGTSDAGITIQGGDYFMFNGIDITEATGSAVEYGYYVRNASATNGAQNNTIKNATIILNKSNSSSIGIYQNVATAATAATGANSNNKYYNVKVENVFNGVYLLGTAGFPDLNTEFGTESGGTTIIGGSAANDIGGSGTVYGIRLAAQQDAKVFNCEVRNLTGTSTSNVQGIYLDVARGTNTMIYNNVVHDIRCTNTSSTPIVMGLRLDVAATYTANVFNNSIYNLANANTTASATQNVRGIAIGVGTSTGNINLYYNSVRIDAPAIASSSAIWIASASVNLKDNVFANFSSGGNATSKRYAIYRSSGTLTTSDYNDLYVVAGTNNFVGFFTTDNATLGNWQTASGKDATSISVDPLFNANSTVPGFGSPLIAAGNPVAGITTDIKGVTRSATNPSIGAYENAADVTAPVITYTNLASSCISGNRSITATITDAVGVPVAGALQPRIYFKKRVAGTWYSQQGSLATGTGTNGTWNFTIDAAQMGGLTVGDTVYYYIIAQDAAGNVSSNPDGVVATDVNTVSTHPASPAMYIVGATLNGNYTVGTSGAYPTLTAAINAYNVACLSGPVTFTLTDATYSGETLPIAINSNPDASATNTLTIKPAIGINPTISGAVDNDAVIKLNASRYVTIDGSNSGSDNRNLVISNTSTTAPTAISIVSSGLGLGANYVTIKNTHVNAGSTSIGYGISVGASVPGTNGADNDFITVQNNRITGASVGIFASGTTAVAAGGLDNLAVSRNNIIVNTTSATAFGIRVGNALNSAVSQDTISVITTAAGQPVGISLETGFISSTVMRNVITKVYTSATGGYGGRGIVVGTGTATSALVIANNTIGGVEGLSNYSGFGNSSAMGIAIGIIGNSTTLTTVAGGINVYFNSVNMSGNFTGYSSAATVTAALYVGSAASALDIRNNIFVNTQSNQNATYAATSKNYAVYSAVAKTAFTTINYNDYFVSGAQGVLGYLAADKTTLSDWQTATSQDANSITADPLFTSATDLHLQTGSPVKDAGVAIAGITQDIDFENRDAAPDMGADEMMGVVPVTFTSIKAYQQNAGVQVNWSITTELNVARYEVEKSADGRTFTTSGSVQARNAGNYNWYDASPVSGNNYYRVKAVNVNGLAQYTSVAKVYIGKGGEAISVYPNPVKGDALNLQFINLSKGNYTINISNQVGQKVFSQVISHGGGSANQLININNKLAAGIYQLQVIGQDVQYAQTIMRQ